MNPSRAIEELETFAGRQFDPQLVKLVSKSTSIRRLLGTDRSPEPSPETPRVPRPAWAHRLAQ
jgi:HD-GYP domain-containing protein (c-di-GMP phosphodiesterase class II)